jgi:CRP-like cAMP-binding protein
MNETVLLNSKTEDAIQPPQTWIIVESLVGAGIINLLRDRPSIRVVTKEELQGNQNLRIKKGDKVIIATETVMDEALNKLEDDEKRELVSRLKNKVNCRQMLTSIFPDFFFREIPVRDLPNIELVPGEKYFVKPIKGYWGSAAFPVDGQSDRVALMHEIETQLAKRTNLFSEQVVAKDRLIVEEFLEGEEYAVDMFFNEYGQAVITNICHHPLPKKLDYLHVVYYTSYEVYRNLYSKFIQFFNALNQSLNARSIPIHGEFKLHKGKLTPIELNPLRFGSDGFADLSFHAFGFNPFLYFAENRVPDWETLWKGREEKIFAFYLGYNGSDLDTGNFRPDFRNFRRLFSHILSDTAMNYQDTLAFAVMYIEEDSLERIHELLAVEFNEYFVDLKQYSERSYRELYRAGTEMKLSPGQILWKVDAPGDYLVLILQGELEVFLPDSRGEILLETYGPGAAVGELSAIDGLPRSAAVRAKTRAKVMKIAGSVFRELIQRTPDILEDLFWQQVNRVRKLNHELTNIKHGDLF